MLYRSIKAIFTYFTFNKMYDTFFNNTVFFIDFFIIRPYFIKECLFSFLKCVIASLYYIFFVEFAESPMRNLVAKIWFNFFFSIIGIKDYNLIYAFYISRFRLSVVRCPLSVVPAGAASQKAPSTCPRLPSSRLPSVSWQATVQA